MVWEMARWKPKVYVDVPFTPVTFPRNGEITVFIPNSLNPPSSKKLMLYDYLFVPSKEYAIAVNTFGIPMDRVRIVGYPKIDDYDEVHDVFDKELVYKPDGNAGLRVATLLHQIGIGNSNFQMSLSSEPNLYKFIARRKSQLDTENGPV